MKNLFLFLIIMSFSSLIIAQENKDLSILQADSTWAKEIIKFPIDWAPKMSVTGFEELRFSKEWSNKESDTFWSLVIAWSIHTKTPLTTENIESNFNAYFDGLMKPNHWSSEFPEPNTLFVEKESNLKNRMYIGKMRFFDGFHTGKIITIHITVHQSFCATQQKAILVFRVSQQGFEHSIWESLKNVAVKSYICD